MKNEKADQNNLEELVSKYGLTYDQLLQFVVKNNFNLDSKSDYARIIKILNTVFKDDITKREHINKTNLKSIKIYDFFFENNNYYFNFEDDINIYLSENGVGKTTMLNLIIAILENDYDTINEINFSKVEIQTQSKTFTLNKKEINTKLRELYISVLDELKDILYLPTYMQLVSELNSTGKINTKSFESEIRRIIRRRSDSTFAYRKSLRIIQELSQQQNLLYSEQITDIKKVLDLDILFYPTYRKIEAPQNKVFYNQEDDEIEITNKYISFGMRDVENRINGLLDQLRDTTNRSYLAINSQIINDLSTTELSKLGEDKDGIDFHKFEIVINRIGKEKITKYDQLVSFIKGEDFSLPNSDFLRFYIKKLISIYDNQKALNDRIKNFVNVCNKYLVNKKIKYDESTLKIHIVSDDDKILPISFDELSSGEKQIVSIFSKVYLDVTSSSLFIIDEPELSLSIEWQKTFLIDIYNSNKVGLLIATTHSPFIFKNNFNKYVKDIDVCKD